MTRKGFDQKKLNFEFLRQEDQHFDLEGPWKDQKTLRLVLLLLLRCSFFSADIVPAPCDSPEEEEEASSSFSFSL